MLRKTVSVLSAALLVFTLSSCGTDASDDTSTPRDSTVPALQTDAATLAEATLPPSTSAAVSSRLPDVTDESRQALTSEAAFSTFTGYPPLSPVTFTAADPENKRGLSTEKISYGYGVARDGVVSSTSKSAQDYFDSHSCNAVSYDNKSAEKTVYLTFDCGYENGNTSKILDTLKQKNVPAAFFCTVHQMKSEPELTARMIKEGHIIGNHSNKHPDFAKISRERMATEILECENYMRENFGYTSRFFRFPEGSYSECALELVGSMGMMSVFWSVAYVDWDMENQRGGDYAFNTITSRLHSGAILLLHSVSPDNAEALGRIIDFARENGYVFRSLEQYGV